MLYTIENEKLKVSISDKGAELQNIILKSDGTEYLWQGDERFWSGRAYNLFPICGRLTDGRYTYKGKTYNMNLHGFARASFFRAEMISDTKAAFVLTPDDEIRTQYPFDFLFRVTYSLNDTELTVSFDVVNNDTDDMYFGIGGHPGFNVPMCQGESFEDYYLEFDCEKPAKRLVFTPLFDTGKTEPFPLKEGKILELKHSLFDNDAIFLTDMCGSVTLKSRKSGKRVRVEYPGMKYLGLWHAPHTEAPYICIEPWCSLPSYDGVVDDLETKHEMTKLGSGCEYNNMFKIKIT